MATVAARDAATSARRRRERQLRAFHQHEVLLVKMALATALHHSAQRVEVPREVEEHEAYVGPRAQKTPPPGMRPASLAEPEGAQERVKRHTVEQFGELAPTVQILDAPVPQSGDQLLETLKNDVVELVIEVPKIILLDYTPLRAVPGEPQLVEQLVDVPVPVWTELTRDRGSPEGSSGGSWVLNTTGRSPPAQGGKEILGKVEDLSTAPCIWQSLVLCVLA